MSVRPTPRASSGEQLRKAEEATRIDPPQPINLDDAPWWLKEALLRWSVTEGLSAD
jgi:hypothetical protein